MNHVDTSGVQPHEPPAIVPDQLSIDDRVDRLDELISLYFDEQLAADEMTELEGLIFQDDANLGRYIDHARLHADLYQMFNPTATDTTSRLIASLAESELADD